MAARNRKNRNSPTMIEIYRDTRFYFSNFDPNKLPPTQVYTFSTLPSIPSRDDRECPVKVVNADTLDVAAEFARQGLKTMVLNMASAVSPGGGVASGKTAQEECLFRRSNAFLTHPAHLYPISAESCLYSPEILVIKDSEYNRMKSKDFFQVSMLTLPAVRKPRRKGSSYMYEKDRLAMQERIDAIFKIGIIQGAQVLILGAFGCGVYDNPQNEVIAMFQQCLTKYRAYFESIIFAVLAVGPNGTENYEKFSAELN